MEFSYFIKFAEPTLSSGILSWISLYTWVPMCLFCSADRDLKFLKKCRNIVSRQATCSQITDPAWVGGRVVLQKWDLKILPQNQNPCLLPAVSFLFFSSLSFLPFLHWVRQPWQSHRTPRVLIIHGSLLGQYVNAKKWLPDISPLKKVSRSPQSFTP